MKQFPAVIYDAVAKEHRPLVQGSEAIQPGCFPISQYPGNTLSSRGDGLYQGGTTMPPLLYVNTATGVDGNLDPSGGATTVKTLDYALSLIESYKPSDVTLLLQCGQTFEITNTRKLTNTNLTISYYGSTKYPLAGVRYQTSTIYPQLQMDLVRPKIVAKQFLSAGGLWTCKHLYLKKGSLTLKGVKVDTPDFPAGTSNIYLTLYSNRSDIVVSEGATINLEGTIINKTDRRSFAGFLGIVSRAHTTLTQYASQIQVEGTALDEHTTNAELLAARGYFIKFYPDLPTDDQVNLPSDLVATAVGSTDGCGILTLMWLDCSSLPDSVTGSASLQTFPLADYSFGVANYIYGIRRDQQHRPLNIISNLML